MKHLAKSFFYARQMMVAAFMLPTAIMFVLHEAEAAPYVDPNSCGGDGQPACYISAAKKERNINPGDGAFRDPRKGGEWWNCDGWTRTWSAVNAWDACSTGNIFTRVDKKRATFIYSEKEMVNSGAFADVLKGEWWRCPEGFTRNANLDIDEACSASIGKACDASDIIAVAEVNRGFSWEGGGFTCYKKNNCGAEGQRTCLSSVDDTTGCNSGLAEDLISSKCNNVAAELDKDFDRFFSQDWEGRAITHQVGLSRDVPLAKATMIGSHNSYNTKAYGYIDPNQALTMLEQLKAGAHFLEMDLHDDSIRGVILCHSKHEKGKSGACGIGDKKLSNGLNEVKSFLEDTKYKDRILIIYFENFSTKTSDIYNTVQEKIGQYVYNSGGCVDIPADTLTAGQILDAGKRVLIWNGSEIEKECSDHQDFKNMVFKSLGSIKRTWEDEAKASVVGGAFNQWTPADVVKEIEAGKNLANHDFLKIDSVLRAMAWSWNTNEPNDAGGEDCAVQSGSARLGKGHVWNDLPCSTAGIAYACENKKGEWKVTSGQNVGQWSQGDAMCKVEHGAEYFFSVPATAHENVKLTNAKQASSQAGKSLWLNYTDQAQEGTWVGKHRWNTWDCGAEKPCWKNATQPFLAAEGKLLSPDGKTSALMKEDCNFVINSDGKQTWTSGTNGKGTGCQLVFQTDGNLVIYKTGGVPIWASNTYGKGDDLTLQLQDNGNLVMHDASQNIIWKTGL